MELIFATNNKHKAEEVQKIVPANIKITTLQEAGLDIDIPEPHETLEQNAAEKGRTIFAYTGKNCFAEDTGLEVKSLKGEPGVYSGRYAGEEKSAEKNIEKLLQKLEAQNDRTAQFRTAIFLVLDNQEYFFEGVCRGEITLKPEGSGGFGYDSIFRPDGYQKTFAQMTLEEKSEISHRRKAMDKLVTFLNHYE